ncbi:MAG TPA: sortase [Chloroflexia bacterium]|nr:sortase [Chloroflexia bacterium]
MTRGQSHSHLVLPVVIVLLLLAVSFWLGLGNPRPLRAPTLSPTPPPATPTATIEPSATPLPPTATRPPSATATPVSTPPPTPTTPPATPTLAAAPSPTPPLASAPPVRPVARGPARPPSRASTPAPPHLMTVYAPGGRYGDPRPPDPHRIVHISSPDVPLNADVIEVYVRNGLWQVADYAAGHHWGTANPGQGGNIVLTGHNNWHGEVFRYLEFLQPGNTIDVVTADGGHWRYIVQQMQKLPEKNVSWDTQMQHAEVMDPTPFERLTLITCWPYKTYTHRLVIFAAPAP